MAMGGDGYERGRGDGYERGRTSAVFGTMSSRRVISMRPAGAPPMVMSKKTIGVPMVNVVYCE
jgi:hypothetical protein